MRERRYPIVIERTATGFSAYSRDVPGCASAGDTEEDTRSNLREALAAHFEAMREIGRIDSRAYLFGRLRRGGCVAGWVGHGRPLPFVGHEAGAGQETGVDISGYEVGVF
jgi:predicted RNase H-like HicB family nuclease